MSDTLHVQEWLWCETWCGNGTKAQAKTIDLCNNPLTKEPKLDGARRIVKEWPALDAEQRAFTQQVGVRMPAHACASTYTDRSAVRCMQLTCCFKANVSMPAHACGSAYITRSVSMSDACI